MDAGLPTWESAPFRNQPTEFIHSLVYVLGDCLCAIKNHRDQTNPGTQHHNLQLVILTCSFFEASMSRGLFNAASYRIGRLPHTAEAEPERRSLSDCLDLIVDGEVYGNPFPKNPSGQKSYVALARAILDVDLAQAIPAETREAMRCLFLLRNIAVHGQTVSASGIMPDKFDGLVAGYRLRPSEKLMELEGHLRVLDLLQPMTLKGGVGFPFLNSAVSEHFMRAMVLFFRALQDRIADKQLCHEFGSGLPQGIFPILAGEAFQV